MTTATLEREIGTITSPELIEKIYEYIQFIKFYEKKSKLIDYLYGMDEETIHEIESIKQRHSNRLSTAKDMFEEIGV
jgi:hypothetical protein